MSDSLAACIQLDQEQLAPDLTLYHGVSFVLDQQRLLDLLAMRAQGRHLMLSDDFLLAWRRYVLFCENNRLQHSWSFVLRYEGEGIFQTLISLDGDVLQQVSAAILPQTSLYDQLSGVYGWLMQQLFLQLPWRTQAQGKWLKPTAWMVAIAVVGMSVALKFGQFMGQPWLILPALLCLWLLQWGVYRLLKSALPLLRRRLLREVLDGFFAKNDHARKLGLKLLTRF